jgi:hypothetical protein|tara:strand:- start:220 stop:459 length:240 start_codon:yes stop_codon:yes gene_type:complete
MKIIKNLWNKIKRLFRSSVILTYEDLDGKIEDYEVKNLDFGNNYFGNKYHGNVGVRAWCYRKRGVRSFRYEGIWAIRAK